MDAGAFWRQALDCSRLSGSHQKAGELWKLRLRCLSLDNLGITLHELTSIHLSFYRAINDRIVLKHVNNPRRSIHRSGLVSTKVAYKQIPTAKASVAASYTATPSYIAWLSQRSNIPRSRLRELSSCCAGWRYSMTRYIVLLVVSFSRLNRPDKLYLCWIKANHDASLHSSWSSSRYRSRIFCASMNRPGIAMMSHTTHATVR